MYKKYTIIMYGLGCFNISLCMTLSEFKHKPEKTAFDLSTMAIRCSLATRPMNTVNQISSANIVRPARELEKKWVCYDYALQQTTGYFNPQNTRDASTRLIFNPETFFEQTQYPEKNDLVIYTNSEHNRTINHFAVFKHRNLFESKWGTNEDIMEHKPFDVPDYYGNAISFWTLKEEFKKPDGKAKLLEAMESDANNRIGRGLLVFPITIGICLGTIVAGTLSL